MALAIIMIVLIGVMGAGLLTFVSKDLNTVTEENRGQRAFELADAGVNAAKRQLFSDCGSDTNCQRFYNDTSPTVFVGDEDKRWSKVKGGLTLNNLDGVAGTSDSATVEIQFTGSGANPYNFTVTSTGNYGSAKRKIEAKLKGIGGGAGGGGAVVNPGYYTPSDIMIEGSVGLSGLSLFSVRNIIIRDLSPKTPAGFRTDFKNSGGNLKVPDTPDPLDTWYSPDLTPPDNWNLIGRKKEGGSGDYKKFGFAAEGKICSATTTCTSSTASVADGVYGYDSTTDTTAGGNGLRFYAKDGRCSAAGVCPTPLATQPANTITYPFPRLTPDASRLKTLAMAHPGGSTYYACPTGAPSTCTPPWSTLYPTGGDADKVVFIDAKKNDLTFDLGTGTVKGILVIWCGKFELRSPYQGIILNLRGNGTSWGGTDCSGTTSTDTTRGSFVLSTTHTETVKTWVFAEGGTGASDPAGIVLKDDSELQAVPGGGTLASVAFGSGPTPPTAFEVEGWRELYQDP